MSISRPMISESIAFEQNLAALESVDERHLALPEINPVLNRFVLGLRPDDIQKSARFEALTACRHFDANHPIAAQATIPVPRSGLPIHTQRPVEFAICQFLASQGSPGWGKAIARMAVNPRFEGAFQRPLLFTQVVLMEADRAASFGSEDDNDAEPIVHHQKTPCFATTFLLQELPHFPKQAQSDISSLVRSIQLRMESSARSQAAVEQFLLPAASQEVQSHINLVRARLLANTPIAVRR